MPNRQHLVTYGVSTVAAATITVAALLQPWRGAAERPNPQPQPPAVVAKHPVDVVFAVDTTSSMTGLLDGAKRTVWSIATHIRQADPDAELRIGLVAYRDTGDVYVTRDFALTTDLDAVFAELTGYQAEGGGDTPEDVAAGLYDAVHKMQWRDGAKKLMFLVGDAPPADRHDVPTYDVIAREAAERQIIINTIRCGQDSSTAQAWQQIAALGHGQFSTIQQDGGVQQVATPYDDKLSEVSARIDSTNVIVGDDSERRDYDRKMTVNKRAPAASNADRASYYAAKPAAPRVANDLVGGYASGAMSVEAAPAAALPPEMRAMTKPELKAEITRRLETRKAAEQELKAIAKQRDEYLRTHGKGKDGFDAKVNQAVDLQLK